MLLKLYGWSSLSTISVADAKQFLFGHTEAREFESHAIYLTFMDMISGSFYLRLFFLTLQCKKKQMQISHNSVRNLLS